MGHLSHQMSIIRCSFAFGDNYIPFQIPIPYEKVAEDSRDYNNFSLDYCSHLGFY